MNIEELREYCIAKKGVTECFPFDDTALVFKVGDKMFALLDLSVKGRGISLKCDPDLAIELREQYKDVTPAYHFNKKHWNGINLKGSVGINQVKEWIDNSYDIVFSKLPSKLRSQIGNSI